MSSKVIIVGVGVSGISAAMHLARNGFEVEILESKNMLGGRLFSFKDNYSGEIVDNGQHVFSGAYDIFLGILDELGTSVNLSGEKSLKVNFANDRAEHFVFDTTKFKGSPGIILGLVNFRALSLASKLLLIRFVIRLKLNKIDDKHNNCLALLAEEKQNKELINVFWKPLIYSVLNDSPENVAPSLLLEVLRRAFFAAGDSSTLLLSTMDLSALLLPFEKWLAGNNGQIHFQSVVKRLLFDGDKIKGVKLKDGSELFADYVITTVQPNALIRLLEDYPNKQDLQYLNKFRFSTIINIYYWLNRHIDTPEFSALIGTEGDIKSQWLFNRRNFVKGDELLKKRFPGMINITISGAGRLENISSTDLINQCFDELCLCYPEFKQVKILHSRLIRDKFATFRASQATESLRPAPKSSVGNLYLAGDWTNTMLPATIEGAALSGKNAAEFIIKKQHKRHT